MNLKNFLILFLIIIFSSCTKSNVKKSVINEKSLNTQVLEAYKEGMESLKQGDVLFAAKNLMRLRFYIRNRNGHPNHLLWQHMLIIQRIITMMQFQS